MEQRHIERIRNPQFPVARHGYDKREVDNFMLELANWLESRAAEEVGSFAVKRKLEMVGRSTANILMAAENEAEELRRTTEEEMRQVRDNSVREVEDKLAAATSKARSTVEEGQRRRAALESQITELEALRDRVLNDLERLGKELGTAVAANHPGASADLLGTLSGKADRRPRRRTRPAEAPTEREPSP